MCWNTKCIIRHRGIHENGYNGESELDQGAMENQVHVHRLPWEEMDPVCIGTKQAEESKLTEAV